MEIRTVAETHKKVEDRKGIGGRGKKIDMQDYFDKIKDDLILGYSIYRACVFAGVPYSTVNQYYKESPKWRKKIDKVSANACRRARLNFVNAINDGDLGASEKWLKDKENMFREKVDITANVSVNDFISKLDNPNKPYDEVDNEVSDKNEDRGEDILPTEQSPDRPE
jgi:hypothetical protein